MATYGQLMILASLDFDMVKYPSHKVPIPNFFKEKTTHISLLSWPKDQTNKKTEKKS
jgi:hypothetical protein